MNKTVLAAILAIVVVAAGGAYFYMSRENAKPVSAAAERSSPAAAGAAAPAPNAPATAELMAPGPLPEQSLGSANAPVTIIEYASLTCPHCGTFHTKTFPDLKQRYIDTGKVRFIFREFPLDNYAASGFMLARCAGEGKFFPIIEAFYKQQQAFFSSSDPYAWFENFAKQVGFTQQSMEACLTNKELGESVFAVRSRAAEKFGVDSTPTFFINGKIVRGAMTIQELEKEIAPLLRS